MPLRNFTLVGGITETETIAVGRGIDEFALLNRKFGKGRWRKLKGIARVRLDDDTIHTAEIHWYEAHAIGKMKIKYLLD